jgi:hypothetical protein
MRYVLLALIVAFTSTAQAEPIEIGMHSTLAIGPPTNPHTFRVTIAPYANGNDQTLLLNVSGLTPADEGSVWTIDETTAASYGVSWSMLESLAASPVNIRLFHSFRSDGGTLSTGAIEEICQPWHCILDFELDRVESTLERFDILDSGQRITEYSTVIYGTGRVVPEPLSLALMLSGASMHGLVWQIPRRRRRR